MTTDREFLEWSHTIRRTPWAILPAALDELRSRLALARARLEARDPRQAGGPVGASSRPTTPTTSGRVAVVPIVGILTQRNALPGWLGGGPTTEQLGRVIGQLVNDPGVTAIVLDIDSPGGSVFGIQELGDQIHQASDGKRVIAVANAVAASGAYWLASQAGEVVVTPSGQVGSIGVYLLHEDISQAEQKAGFKTTLVSAGRFKTEGNPFEPLTEEARSAMQAEVDDYYNRFVKAVARGRGVSTNKVESTYGQGRMVLAKDAAALGMADRVASLDQVLTDLGVALRSSGSSRPGGASRGGIDLLRRKLDLARLDLGYRRGFPCM